MIGENIKRLRLAKNLTQTELGKAIGVAGGTIQRYESGDISPPLDRLEQIAEALGVETVDLIVEEKNYKEIFKQNFNSNFIDIFKEVDCALNNSSNDISELKIFINKDNPEIVEEWSRIVSKKHNLPFTVALMSHPLFTRLSLQKDEGLFDLVISYFAIIANFYYEKMFDFFYEDDYKPLVNNQKFLLNTLDTYSNQNETLKREVKALEKRIKDQDTMLAEYENLVSNHISGIAKKETLTESDIEELKKDFEDKFQQQQDTKERDI